MRKLIYIAILALAVSGCKKDEEVNRIPAIEFISISETMVVSFENSVTIRFSYTDENGDLGFADPDATSLRIKDARLSDYDWYHIPPMTPDNQELNISGTYTVELNPLFILGNSEQETTKFDLQIKDREGNWSNTISSPTVTIVESM
ncbi:hypothetical protein [Sanyastnella coralliicola]|uniref:hypothetical protein n=1 Tax=Sanyastnella coralliicola TaxID=3069118 RepID=UPI0027B9681D|nr:hypothetical protein [Longitalea sp. SCSIO 12813]